MPVAVVDLRQPHGGRAHAARRQRPRRLLRHPGRLAGGRRVVLRRRTAGHDGHARGYDQGLVRARERFADRLDGAAVSFRVLREPR